MQTDPPPGLLYEMMRSFVTLARTLNLSQAVRELNCTRQTLRRHIGLLEEYKGGPLFELTERQYQLTPLGKNSLGEARRLLSRTEAWLNSLTSEQDGLYRMTLQSGPETFMLQQHQMSEVWKSGAALIQSGVRIWAGAKGQLECPHFAPLRPYLRIFRPSQDGWICTDVGAESSFATFFGWTWERSSIGRDLCELPGGEAMARLMDEAYGDIRDTHGLRFDHVFTRICRSAGAPPTAMSYHQLLMGCRFPDDSFALACLESRTRDVKIDSLPADMGQEMTEDLVMRVNLPQPQP
ncbi:helix-turn-helix domain-containing protein [Aliiroseovarius crassostreae]|uniref:helix-turn-helix domain-containing protein n=1 Tax=Aliiroseovarius crassostreae TaxID=154981 RepID=UPI0021FBB0EF|nr:LysR family transcriptional regulator [Aliiroseovarius crassostreae]UWP88186.1 LysR family transcriptional regulator [Aliiroseovarius crassostreae]